MITLAFAQMIYYFAISWPAYGGEDGLSITSATTFPASTPCSPLSFFLICYARADGRAGLFVAASRDSRFGAALAGRQAERDCASPRSASGRSPSGSPPS